MSRSASTVPDPRAENKRRLTVEEVFDNIYRSFENTVGKLSTLMEYSESYLRKLASEDFFVCENKIEESRKLLAELKVTGFPQNSEIFGTIDELRNNIETVKSKLTQPEIVSVIRSRTSPSFHDKFDKLVSEVNAFGLDKYDTVLASILSESVPADIDSVNFIVQRFNTRDVDFTENMYYSKILKRIWQKEPKLRDTVESTVRSIQLFSLGTTPNVYLAPAVHKKTHPIELMGMQFGMRNLKEIPPGTATASDNALIYYHLPGSDRTTAYRIEKILENPISLVSGLNTDVIYSIQNIVETLPVTDTVPRIRKPAMVDRPDQSDSSEIRKEQFRGSSEKLIVYRSIDGGTTFNKAVTSSDIWNGPDDRVRLFNIVVNAEINRRLTKLGKTDVDALRNAQTRVDGMLKVSEDAIIANIRRQERERADDKRADDMRADDKRADDKRTDDKRADDKRADDKRAPQKKNPRGSDSYVEADSIYGPLLETSAENVRNVKILASTVDSARDSRRLELSLTTFRQLVVGAETISMRTFNLPSKMPKNEKIEVAIRKRTDVIEKKLLLGPSTTAKHFAILGYDISSPAGGLKG